MAVMDIPGFELIEKIGAGGMATVWKARQLSLNRTVAIKILYSKFAVDPLDVQRFQHEAQSAARLKHSGIVQIYDANAIEGVYYFVMEYVAGYTVGQWLKRRGVLSVKDALLVTQCVVDALLYAWNEAALIHCDIKPENVMVDADGSVKVSDLGLARTLSTMALSTATDEIMGTPSYMAPEQALGEPDLDYRADIYALGATLYHMVTGRVPFAGGDAETVMNQQVNGTLPDPMDLNPKLPAAVCWVIEHMMAKEPDARPDSWEAVRREIELAKKGIRPSINLAPGESTVARSRKRVPPATRPQTDLWTAPKATPMRSGVRLAGVLAIAAGALYVYLQWKSGAFSVIGLRSAPRAPDAAPTQPPVTPDATPPTVPEQSDASLQWEQAYDEAVAWYRANPGEFDEAIARFQRISREASGTAYGSAARTRVEALRAEREQRVHDVMADLQVASDALIQDGEQEAAARLYESYTGALAAETSVDRAARAQAIRAQAPVSTTPPSFTLEGVVGGVVARAMSGRLDEAITLVDEALNDAALDGQYGKLLDMRQELNAARRVKARIMGRFADSIGQIVEVEMRTGKRRVRVVSVEGSSVVADLVGGTDDSRVSARIEITEDHLAFRERIRRLGDDSEPGVLLVKGIMAAEAGSGSFARRYLSQTSPVMAQALVDATAGLP
jgi:tRNA A-37 threonylcarbamoyl transferase component Bud32